MDNSKVKKPLKIRFNIDTNKNSASLGILEAAGASGSPNNFKTLSPARIQTRKLAMSAPSDFPDSYDSGSNKKCPGSPSRVRFSEFLPPGMDDEEDLAAPKALVKEKVSMDAFYADLEFIRCHMRANVSSPDLSPNTSVTPNDDMDQVPANNAPSNNENPVVESEPTPPSQMPEADKALALFDWICPYTPNLKNPDSESASHSAVSAPQVNLQIYQSNPVIYSGEGSEATSQSLNSFPIEKSKLVDSESASFWDYIPPAPESIHDCEVDSGNVDALVSHVLQQSLPTTTTEKKSEPQPSSFLGKSQSSFLNPGISINFNYSPIFSNPVSLETSAAASAAGWTWNQNQQNAVSRSRVQPALSSAYFPARTTSKEIDDVENPEGQAPGPCHVDVGTETDEEETQVNVPEPTTERRKVPRHPYILQLSPSVSDISLVPLVNSLTSVVPDTGSQEDPEDVATDCDEIETEFTESIDQALFKVDREEASEKELIDETDCGTESPLGSRIIEILNQFNTIEDGKEEPNENELGGEVDGGTASPLGSRIIEILNQFNKVEDEIRFPTIRLANETPSSSRRRSAPSVNVLKSQSRTSNNSIYAPNKQNPASAPARDDKNRPSTTKPPGKSPMYRVPKSKPNRNISEDLQPEFITVPARNIVRENIVLAKYPIRQISGSFRTLRTTHETNNTTPMPLNPAFIPILVETQRIPAPPSLRHSRSRPQTQTTAAPKHSSHHFHQMSHSRQVIQQNMGRGNPVHRNSFKGTVIDSKRSNTDPGNVASGTQSKTTGPRRAQPLPSRSVQSSTQDNGGDQDQRKSRKSRSRSGSTSTYNIA